MAVNLSPIWGAGAQLLDNSGNVLSGGKIYTYLAGTTTPAVTYTSSNGITANSNPIILNSAGRVPYEIWLTDSIEYKFVLKDSNDVLIGTWDNLIGINSNFINYYGQQEIQTATAGQTVFTLTDFEYTPATGNLSVFVDGVNQYGPGAQYAYVETDSTTVTFVSGLHVGASVKFTTTKLENVGVADASQISYTYPDSNAVTQNVEERLAQYVSVKDFGAVGDGVTDDTVAIQNAVDAVSANGGGVVNLLTATYKVTASITLPTKVILNGTQRDSSVISATHEDQIIVLTGDACGLHNLTLTRVTTSKGYELVDGHGIATTTVIGYPSFDNVFVENCNRGISITTDSGGMYGGQLSNIQFKNCYYGFYKKGNTQATAACTSLNFVNLQMMSCFNGVYADLLHYSTISSFADFCGLTASNAGEGPSNEHPILYRFGDSANTLSTTGTTITSMGVEYSDIQLFYIDYYSTLKVCSIRHITDVANFWTYSGSRVSNVSADKQAWFIYLGEGGFFSLDNTLISYLNTDNGGDFPNASAALGTYFIQYLYDDIGTTYAANNKGICDLGTSFISFPCKFMPDYAVAAICNATVFTGIFPQNNYGFLFDQNYNNVKGRNRDYKNMDFEITGTGNTLNIPYVGMEATDPKTTTVFKFTIVNNVRDGGSTMLYDEILCSVYGSNTFSAFSAQSLTGSSITVTKDSSKGYIKFASSLTNPVITCSIVGQYPDGHFGDDRNAYPTGPYTDENYPIQVWTNWKVGTEAGYQWNWVLSTT